MASRRKAATTTPSETAKKTPTETPCSNAALMRKLTGIDKLLRSLQEILLDVDSKIDLILEEEGDENQSGDDEEIENDSDDES